MKDHHIIYLILPFIFLNGISLQASDPEKKSVAAIRINENIIVDGETSEDAWSRSEPVSEFWLNFPTDSMKAIHQTAVKILYNDEYLYVSAELLHAAQTKPYVASSLKRDFPFLENDSFGLIIDPFDDRTNGYGFYVSAYGVQRDEQISNGTNADATWDIKWSSAVKHLGDRWTVEIAIPLMYLRFNESSLHWNVNFLRNDVNHNECSTWAGTPRYFTPGNLAYSGTLEFPERVTRETNTVSIIPSVTFQAGQHRQEKADLDIKPSLDAKVALTPSLNLDVTINPDFSQAEADQAQLNLTRFELVFLEKRLFFVENSDLFSQFGIEKWGTSPVRPFYSRRIGLRYDENSGRYEQTRVAGGLRMSGKLNNDLRIGVMSVQTAQEKITTDESSTQHYYPGQNYTTVAVQHKTFSRSNIGIILSQRQSMGIDSVDGYRWNNKDYSRLAGLEYNLASRDGKWMGKVFHHTLLEPHVRASSYGAVIEYTTKRTLSWIGFTKASPQFTPDAGFVPRTGFFNLYSEISYFIYPKKKKLNFIQPVIHFTAFLDSISRSVTDRRLITGAQWKWKNTAYLYLLLFNDYTRLSQEFNPSRKDGAPTLSAGASFAYNYFRVYYVSDNRKNFSWHVYSDVGEFYNGKIAMVSGYFIQKIHPYGNFGVDYNTTFIKMPGRYQNNALYLLGPRADISLSKSVFINTVVQLNTQTEKLNFYAKMQWRYRPLSDIFIVYTSNTNANPWQRQDQNLVVKAAWWF